MAVTHVGVLAYEKAHGWENELSLGSTPQFLFTPPNGLVRKAWLQVLDSDIEFTDDGSDPTGKGGIINAGDIAIFEHDLPAMRQIKARAITGTARLRRAYYGL